MTAPAQNTPAVVSGLSAHDLARLVAGHHLAASASASKILNGHRRQVNSANGADTIGRLELGHRNWSPGQRPGDDPDAPFVPQELSGLLAEPTDFGRLTDLWPYLCSEDTAWPAAYAAVPYLVELARRLRPAERGDYLYVVGFIVICLVAMGKPHPDCPRTSLPPTGWRFPRRCH